MATSESVGIVLTARDEASRVLQQVRGPVSLNRDGRALGA